MNTARAPQDIYETEYVSPYTQPVVAPLHERITGEVLIDAAEFSSDVNAIYRAAERIEPHITNTPMEALPVLSAQLGSTVIVKREDQQSIHSFKIRGALNKLLKLTAEERQHGVMAASAGNHAQGVAYGARLLGMQATIIMPVTTPRVKVDAVEALGASVILHGDNYSDAYDYSLSLQAKSEQLFIPPFDDQDVIDGQGTVALEMIEQSPDMTHIFVPAGGGGLVAGVGKCVKALRPDIKVIAVEPDDSNAVQLAYAAGYPVPLPKPPATLADGVAVRQAGDLTTAHIVQYVDACITVSRDEMSAALGDFVTEHKSILELSGALAIAGAKKYAETKDLRRATLAAITSGANISLDKVGNALVRAEQLKSHEALFTVDIAESVGSLRAFCRDVVNGHNITEMRYAYNDALTAKIQIGFSMKDQQDKAAFTDKMHKHAYTFHDLSHTAHIKHLRDMPAQTTPIHQELFVIDLPERSGSLLALLDKLDDRFSISLFQYEKMGNETSQVLIGFNITKPDELAAALSAAGYEHEYISHETRTHFRA